jgi:exodeoxyribonuclease VII large subunit
VRLDLLGQTASLGARLLQALALGHGRRTERLRDLARALPRPEALVQGPVQRLDLWSGKLGAALGLGVARKRAGFEARAGVLRPETLHRLIERRRDHLEKRSDAMQTRLARRLDADHARFDKWASRLAPALTRMIGDAARKGSEGRARLEDLGRRLDASPAQRFADLHRRLEALDRTRASLGTSETLRRGYAVVRGDGAVATSRRAAAAAGSLEIEFHDGRVFAVPSGAEAPSAPAKKAAKPSGGTDQGSLF